MSKHLTAIGSGNMRSRTFMSGMGLIVMLVSISTVCMFVTVPGAEGPIANFDQWTEFVTVALPMVFSLMLSAMGYEKHKLAKMFYLQKKGEGEAPAAE